MTYCILIVAWNYQITSPTWEIIQESTRGQRQAPLPSPYGTTLRSRGPVSAGNKALLLLPLPILHRKLSLSFWGNNCYVMIIRFWNLWLKGTQYFVNRNRRWGKTCRLMKQQFNFSVTQYMLKSRKKKIARNSKYHHRCETLHSS